MSKTYHPGILTGSRYWRPTILLPSVQRNLSHSDILKPHFQKCSTGYGNPTGANHLAHQRRHGNSGSSFSISHQGAPNGSAGLSEIAGGNLYKRSVLFSNSNINGDISCRSSRGNRLIAPNAMIHCNRIADPGDSARTL